jgi:diguanylate cyclase (GGDEF)-like protein
MDLAGRTRFVIDDSTFSEVAGKALGNFAVPMGVLGAALLVVGYAPALPGDLPALKIHGPYVALGVGLLLSLAFRRGRALFAILSLLVSYFCFRFYLEPAAEDLLGKTVYAALCIFVPFNIAVLSVMRERGALNAFGIRRLTLLAIEIGFAAAVVLGDNQLIAGGLYWPLPGYSAFPGLEIPQIGFASIVTGVIVAVVFAVLRGSVIDAGFAVAIATFGLACSNISSADTFAWLVAVAGLMVTVAVVQDSYRMAFRDELTGLPGRRALNERLMALERNYTIAMVDVDHFKAFNDSWGHDLGDQVLKLVAARLQRVGGGGTAYRYGGEEFTILFPGRRALGVMPHLETLRRSVETYQLTIRERGRSQEQEPGAAKKIANSPHLSVSVTVSIGVAERGDRLVTPDEVIKAADKALYRAKAGGRNRVSR